MNLIHFTQFCEIDFSQNLKDDEIILVADHTLLSGYGISYYVFGWHQLMHQYKPMKISLWLDCQDDQQLALQAIYANVTGIIVGPTSSQKFQAFAKQQGVGIITSVHELTNG